MLFDATDYLIESDAVGIILEFGQRRSIRQCAQCGCRMSGRLEGHLQSGFEHCQNLF